MTPPTRAFLTGLLIAAVGVGPVIYSVGYRSGSDAVITQAGEQQTIESRIMDIVVRRNPGATVRDFAGFPEHVLAESAKRGIDFRLVLALVDHESEFKPQAVGGRGEIGLMQVLPSTASGVVQSIGLGGYEPPTQVKGGYTTLGSLGDAKLNVTIGLAYLAQMRDEFGPGPAMLRAYNRGSAHAKEHRPHDRYAERVSMRFLSLAHEVH